MKIRYCLLILSTSIFTACQNNSSSTNDEGNVTAVVTKQDCYSYIKNKDTATLSIMSSGHIVTGDLQYHLFEKDNNKGLIKGEMRGDTLLADYAFESEGRQSIRQVAFLQRDGKLIEGFGDVIEKDGKMVFKNLSTLKFGSAIEFTKVNCN